MPAQEPSAAKPNPTRAFGRFELRQLLGKSDRTMAWLAYDPRSQQEVMLTMPRVQPPDEAALALWLEDSRLAARLNHPHLAHVVDTGVEDHWPYIAVDRALGLTLGERLAVQPQVPADEVVGWLIQAVEGLAFAHQSRISHGDLQLHQVLISEQGMVRVMALGASGNAVIHASAQRKDQASTPDAHQLHEVRESSVRDVLTIGLLLHHILVGQPPLDEADTSRVVSRLAPLGRDHLRLPRTTPQPVSDALRAIVDRATSSQPRQRYHNARTLLAALVGWREAARQDDGGVVALLLDRLRTVGHLPAAPGVGARVARLAIAESKRTDEMAEQILQDMALSFELLRYVNSAQVQGTQALGNGPVLTVRRAISLVGLKGVRQAAAALRPWPGPLSPEHAVAMQDTMDRVRLAGHVAQVLRPAGYDPEVIYLVAVLQNLGRLMVQYHFPEEAEQVAELMQPIPSEDPAEPDQPGLSEEAAACAVLGVNTDALGAAVARQWGFNDDVLHMIRRLSKARPVRAPDTDNEALRLAASAANEVVDIVGHTAPARLSAALANVAQRYARAMPITPREINEALHGARLALQSGGSVASPHAYVAPAVAGAADASAPVASGITGFAALLASRQR
jgi:non-specific serine/threonine protein kinase